MKYNFVCDWKLILLNILEGGNAGKDEVVSPTIAADPQDNESNASDGNGSDGGKQKVPSLGETDPNGRYN